MPELPEVHTIVKDLKKYASDANITDVRVAKGYSAYPDNDTLIKAVKEAKILSVERIAKNIVLELSTKYWLVIHLAMTGKLLLRKPEKKEDKWQRISLLLEKNNKQFEIRFCDMRMFGKFKVLTAAELEQTKEKYGPEPLEESLETERFLTIIQSKKTNIKNVLLDQQIVAGLGNVYATDALWIAQIHPETHTSKITRKMADRLLEASREILEEGIKNRGITMSDYVDLFGNPGKQQNYFRVYRKDICTRCNSKIEFKKLNGRGTFFCPNCQIKADVAELLL